MAIVTILPLASFPVQTTPFGPVSVADGLTKLTFEFLRCTNADLTIWPDAGVVISITLTISINGGPFLPWIGQTDSGGIRVAKGVEIPTSLLIATLPQGTNRQINGVVTITGGALRSSATITVV